MTCVKSKGRRRSRAVLALGLAVVFLCAALAAVTYEAIYPSASGSKTYKSGGAVLDVSNASQGYVMVKKQSKKRLKVRITGKNQYTYDLRNDGEYDVYPLQDGSRSYRVAVFEQVKGTSYSQLLSKSIGVDLVNEYAAFLGPNRYCRYIEEGEAVRISGELCEGLETQRQKVETVYEYVTSNFTYDYIKSLTVKPGYVPDLDETLKTRTGICFDHAALMCAMLRSQGIPTKLVMGYADSFYHAWNSILIDGEWVRYDATADIAFFEIRKYTEEAVY
ncbi:MAG: transglutaminase domain-containing protein [Clostridiales bacterium]|jgi:transglutaminase-like putative cysteine protease|nr:transglutaminase domain-containing protein [Clostridiales bacterium]OPZ67405.1 MAG: Transglutaminase-like superfamily protein [Firmicutes bacterium ADurb.Bin467]